MMTGKPYRSLDPGERHKRRIRAFHMVLKHDEKQEEVAFLLGVSRQSLCKWLKAYREGGAKTLSIKNRGRPIGMTLPKFNAATINRLILDNTPDQLGLPFHLWNREALLQLADQHFQKNLSGSTLKRYLEIWNYFRRDDPHRKFWRHMEFDLSVLENEGRLPFEKNYKNVSLQAKREGATVFWCKIDFLRPDYPITPVYDVAGKPTSKSSLGRKVEYFSVSAITRRGVVYFMIFRQKITPPIFIEFMQRLIKENRRKVFIFMIEHRVQRFRSVKKWLEETSSLIRLFPFPPLR